MNTNKSTPAAETDELAERLRAGARGVYTAEAAVELLIATGKHHHVPLDPDSTNDMAWVDWEQVPPGHASGGERRLLDIAASLSIGRLIDLSDALSGLDAARSANVLDAFRWASGWRSTEEQSVALERAAAIRAAQLAGDDDALRRALLLDAERR